MRARFAYAWHRANTSFWFLPGLLIALSMLLAVLSIYLDNTPLGQWMQGSAFVYHLRPDGARAVLSTVAGAMMTTASLVFSLTLVVLTLAAGQMGPRIIDRFMRDRLKPNRAWRLHRHVLLRALRLDHRDRRRGRDGALVLALARRRRRDHEPRPPHRLRPPHLALDPVRQRHRRPGQPAEAGDRAQLSRADRPPRSGGTRRPGTSGAALSGPGRALWLRPDDRRGRAHETGRTGESADRDAVPAGQVPDRARHRRPDLGPGELPPPNGAIESAAVSSWATSAPTSRTSSLRCATLPRSPSAPSRPASTTSTRPWPRSTI